MDNDNVKFNFETFFYKLVAIVIVGIIIYVAIQVLHNTDDSADFTVVSSKPYNNTSAKDNAIEKAYSSIDEVIAENDALLPTNLNINKMYKEIKDNDTSNLYSVYVPIPVVSDEDMQSDVDVNLNVAYQIYSKLQLRYTLYNQMLSNLYGNKPETIIKYYNYDIDKILGQYNPDNPRHILGDESTYKIENFQNVNIHCVDGDGNPIDDDNNIKDIMTMASVYTYFHDPYNVENFLEYCYYLFDNSYSYVASVSEIYYCSGCVHYDNANYTSQNEISYDKIKDHTDSNRINVRELPYKSGRLLRVDDNSYNVVPYDYDAYIDNIYSYEYTNSEYNYCPGHVDLDIYVKVMMLESSNGLPSIDERYGNNEKYYNGNWHGWNAVNLNYARTLYYKDWEKEYALGISNVSFVTPLTREEINYYLNRLDKNVSKDRRKVIETALKSVGRIPYYYGGKSAVFGYENANFGRKVTPDYKGRCLKGLDCSGWVNWVYDTTFNKAVVTADGTAKLAYAGNKITRELLKPGDLIVRPGHDSHVMMFLEWAPGGRVTVIHENGTANNVSIGTYDAYYPYYRSIFDY